MTDTSWFVLSAGILICLIGVSAETGEKKNLTESHFMYNSLKPIRNHSKVDDTVDAAIHDLAKSDSTEHIKDLFTNSDLGNGVTGSQLFQTSDDLKSKQQQATKSSYLEDTEKLPDEEEMTSILLHMVASTAASQTENVHSNTEVYTEVERKIYPDEKVQEDVIEGYGVTESKVYPKEKVKTDGVTEGYIYPENNVKTDGISNVYPEDKVKSEGYITTEGNMHSEEKVKRDGITEGYIYPEEKIKRNEITEHYMTTEGSMYPEEKVKKDEITVGYIYPDKKVKIDGITEQYMTTKGNMHPEEKVQDVPTRSYSITEGHHIYPEEKTTAETVATKSVIYPETTIKADEITQSFDVPETYTHIEENIKMEVTTAKTIDGTTEDYDVFKNDTYHEEKDDKGGANEKLVTEQSLTNHILLLSITESVATAEYNDHSLSTHQRNQDIINTSRITTSNGSIFTESKEPTTSTAVSADNTLITSAYTKDNFQTMIKHDQDSRVSTAVDISTENPAESTTPTTRETTSLGGSDGAEMNNSIESDDSTVNSTHAHHTHLPLDYNPTSGTKRNRTSNPIPLKNDTVTVFPQKTLATVVPNVKSTPLAEEVDINVVEPIVPKPTPPGGNEVAFSSTPVSSKVPIYMQPTLPTTTTDSSSFIISLNPQPRPTVFLKSTTVLLSANTIRDDPNVIAPPGVQPTGKSGETDWFPELYVEFQIAMTANELCDFKKVTMFQVILAGLLERNKDEETESRVSYKQIVFKPVGVKCPSRSTIYGSQRRTAGKTVIVYVKNTRGVYSYKLTDQLITILKDLKQKSFQGSYFQNKVKKIAFHGSNQPAAVMEAAAAPIATGAIVAIVISVVVVLLVIGFVSMQVHIRWRRRGVKTMRQVSTTSSRLSDAQSVADSIQLQGFVRMESGRFSRKRMERGSFAYVNPGLELLDQKGCTSNPLTFIGLAEMLKEIQDIHDEFLMLPNQLSTISDLPPGAEEKNRYSNVIPNPGTRVPLHCLTVKDMKDGADYINANFIRGYQCYPNCYIATQAPLENTIYDFWRMVWQQNSTVIIMLTALAEQGVEKCTEYWPNTEGGDTTRVYGEYRVSQERRIVMPEWIQTTLLLKYKKAKQQKEIHHFWLTSWPKNGVPDYKTLVKFMVQIRPLMDESAGPPVVHCSPGTGRTGVLIAVDICMLSFEDSSIVNVLNAVHQLRKDRGGMVQTKEQYAFIYKVILEYAKMLNNPNSSARSSISSSRSSLYRK